MSGKSRDVAAIVEMLLALLLPLFVCWPGVAIASAGATSILLILGTLFEEKLVTERRQQQPGSRTSRALTFIANFSFFFCSTFPLALRYRGLRFLSVAWAWAFPLPGWVLLPDNVLAAHFQIDYKQDMHCGSVFDGSGSRSRSRTIREQLLPFDPQPQSPPHTHPVLILSRIGLARHRLCGHFVF